MAIITEITLLKLFINSRDTYVKYGSFVKVDSLSREIKVILQDIDAYYEEFNDFDHIQTEKFSLWFHQIRHPDMKEDTHVLYKHIFGRLHEEGLNKDSAFAKKVIEHFQAESIKEQIQQCLEKPGLDGETLTHLLEDYERIRHTIDNDYIECSLDVGRQVGQEEGGLRWRLPCLNECLGPLHPSFTIVAAYVNVGKTSFLASEAAYMAQQLSEGSVLWFNNEQHEGFLAQRIWSAVLKAPWPSILDNYESAERAYSSHMGGDMNRIRLFDIRGKGLPFIKRMAKKYNAKLVIVDMIDKLSVKKTKEGNMADQLEQLYSGVRDFATVTCPVLASSQTDASVFSADKFTNEVRTQHYINMHQLKGSHVGKQGTADAIIAIGSDAQYPSTRYISVPKSKTGRELQQEVTFDGQRSLYY